MTFYVTFQVKNITQTSTETQICEMLPIILLPSSSSFLQGRHVPTSASIQNNMDFHGFLRFASKSCKSKKFRKHIFQKVVFFSW